jgi:UDP-N-acetylglucosamine 2-epimerase (non-hydrolysing)
VFNLGRRSVAYVVGARPNFVKMAPVVRAMKRRLPDARHVIVHTGQHYDRQLAESFLTDLGMPDPDYALGVGSGAHGAQTARALERIEAVLEKERPDIVIVPGDVNSTLAAALAASKLGIPIAHVEAGLRSFDRSMPEEINRILVDQLSDWCFTHSAEAEQHLHNEGISGSRIHPVGNTMIDTLVRMRPSIEASDIRDRLGLQSRGYVLVTLHRPALVDGHLLGAAMHSLHQLSLQLPVVFPIHPRTRARLGGIMGFASHDLHLVEPLGYVDFLALELHAAAVITDSGGVQEETTYLRVPCFTLRTGTERPITLTHGTNRLLGLEPREMERIPDLLGNVHLPSAPPPGWDGNAAERLAEILAVALTEKRDLETAVSQ